VSRGRNLAPFELVTELDQVRPPRKAERPATRIVLQRHQARTRTQEARPPLRARRPRR